MQQCCAPYGFLTFCGGPACHSIALRMPALEELGGLGALIGPQPKHENLYIRRLYIMCHHEPLIIC